MEFRGHENDVEVVVFAPATAYGPIRELAGIPVSFRPVAAFLSSINSLAQNTDKSKRPGQYIASGSRDKTIKVWDTQTGQLLRTLVGIITQELANLIDFLLRAGTTTGFEL